MQQYKISNLQAFVAVVESGSFNKAAEHLDSTTAAISRRVASLEKEIGARLLHRTTRNVSLTDAGARYYQDITDILRALEEADARVAGIESQASGVLRITVPMSFGVKVLGPMIPVFTRQQPELKVVLDLDDRVRDIVSEGLDMAIRIGELKESSLVARKIRSIKRYFCASPEYLEAYGVPQKPNDLIHHTCLRYKNVHMREEWTFHGPEGIENVSVSGQIAANNGELLMEAAIQSQGIVSLPDFLADDQLSSGTLVRILSDYTPPDLGMYAIWPSRNFTPTKIRAMVEFLVAHFGTS